MDQRDAGLAPVISLFVIGLMSGAPGGLLLGGMAVAVLQSLELQADNKLLMDQFGKCIMDSGLNETNNHLRDIQISILATMLGVFSAALSLLAGVYIGLSTYSLVIKKKGEAAMGKALTLAGPACLTGVTAIGCILGLALKSVPAITQNVFWHFFVLLLVIAECAFVIISFPDSLLLQFALAIALIACATFTAYALGFWLEIRLILAAALTPSVLAVKEHYLKLAIIPLPLMLLISGIYKVTGQQIITIQSTNSTNSSSDIIEDIFVGVLASQMWTVTVGMTLFVSCQRGGAGKICAAAFGLGGAVLGVIKSALLVLGPGPSIGALMGVAGAVGVSLTAAVAATDQYGQVVDHYGFVGRVGVTVGAAVGAFLSSCAHSGLSGVFMGLCAAAIPAIAFLIMFLHPKP